MRTPGKDSSITPRGILRLGNSERDGKENEERRSVRFAEQHETKRFRYQFSESSEIVSGNLTPLNEATESSVASQRPVVSLADGFDLSCDSPGLASASGTMRFPTLAQMGEHDGPRASIQSPASTCTRNSIGSPGKMFRSDMQCAVRQDVGTPDLAPGPLKPHVKPFNVPMLNLAGIGGGAVDDGRKRAGDQQSKESKKARMSVRLNRVGVSEITDDGHHILTPRDRMFDTGLDPSTFNDFATPPEETFNFGVNTPPEKGLTISLADMHKASPMTKSPLEGRSPVALLVSRDRDRSHPATPALPDLTMTKRRSLMPMMMVDEGLEPLRRQEPERPFSTSVPPRTRSPIETTPLFPPVDEFITNVTTTQETKSPLLKRHSVKTYGREHRSSRQIQIDEKIMERLDEALAQPEWQTLDNLPNHYYANKMKTDFLNSIPRVAEYAGRQLLPLDALDVSLEESEDFNANLAAVRRLSGSARRERTSANQAREPEEKSPSRPSLPARVEPSRRAAGRTKESILARYPPTLAALSNITPPTASVAVEEEDTVEFRFRRARKSPERAEEPAMVEPVVPTFVPVTSMTLDQFDELMDYRRPRPEAEDVEATLRNRRSVFFGEPSRDVRINARNMADDDSVQQLVDKISELAKIHAWSEMEADVIKSLNDAKQSYDRMVADFGCPGSPDYDAVQTLLELLNAIQYASFVREHEAVRDRMEPDELELALRAEMVATARLGEIRTVWVKTCELRQLKSEKEWRRNVSRRHKAGIKRHVVKYVEMCTDALKQDNYQLESILRFLDKYEAERANKAKVSQAQQVWLKTHEDTKITLEAMKVRVEKRKQSLRREAFDLRGETEDVVDKLHQSMRLIRSIHDARMLMVLDLGPVIGLTQDVLLMETYCGQAIKDVCAHGYDFVTNFHDGVLLVPPNEAILTMRDPFLMDIQQAGELQKRWELPSEQELVEELKGRVRGEYVTEAHDRFMRVSQEFADWISSAEHSMEHSSKQIAYQTDIDALRALLMSEEHTLFCGHPLVKHHLPVGPRVLVRFKYEEDGVMMDGLSLKFCDNGPDDTDPSWPFVCARGDIPVGEHEKAILLDAIFRHILYDLAARQILKAVRPSLETEGLPRRSAVPDCVVPTPIIQRAVHAANLMTIRMAQLNVEMRRLLSRWANFVGICPFFERKTVGDEDVLHIRMDFQPLLQRVQLPNFAILFECEVYCFVQLDRALRTGSLVLGMAQLAVHIRVRPCFSDEQRQLASEFSRKLTQAAEALLHSRQRFLDPQLNQAFGDKAVDAQFLNIGDYCFTNLLDELLAKAEARDFDLRHGR